MKRTAGWVAAAILAGVPAMRADTDYFVVGAKGNASPQFLHIFSYDTATTTVTYRACITNSYYCNMDMGLSALPNYGFAWGHRGAPNIQRYATRDRVTWTNEGATVDINQFGPGAFWDSGVRTNRDTSKTENYTVGVAMLKDGKLFVSGDRLQSNTVYYGVGSLAGKTGALTTNVFPRDLNHLGIMANSSGAAEQGLWDVTSTIEGTANRFVTAYRNAGAPVLVYNSDGTYRGALTAVGSNSRGLGVFKSAARGDTILQVDIDSGINATVRVRGIRVDEAAFNTAVFTITNPPAATRGFLCTGGGYRPPDVDGLESGRIVVLGFARDTSSGEVRKMGIQIFETNKSGTTWTNVFAKPLWLDEAAGAPSGTGGETVAGLYAIRPPTGTIVCFR